DLSAIRNFFSDTQSRRSIMSLIYETALITGAGSGVGRATAQQLARLGLKVALLGRERAKLDETASMIQSKPGYVMVERCDVSDRAAVQEIAKRILDAFGSVDVLVSNAGINVPKRSLEALDPADWDRMLATNLTGSYNLLHAILPGMRSRKRGL